MDVEFLRALEKAQLAHDLEFKMEELFSSSLLALFAFEVKTDLFKSC